MPPRKTESVLELLNHAVADNGHSVGDELLRRHHPADVVEALEGLETDERDTTIEAMSTELCGWLLPFVPDDEVDRFLTGRTDTEIAAILESMPADDAVDLLENMAPKRRESILAEAIPNLQATLRTLLKSKPESAGTLMTTEYLKIDGEWTAGKAVEEVEKLASDVETPYAAYVVTDENHLRGVISLRELLSADKDAVVDDLMRTEPATAHVDEDQEKVARTIERYDILAVPVLDHMGRVVGVITHDDVLDVTTEEATEDIFKSAGISFAGVEESRSTAILDSSIPRILGLRLPWLVLALAGGMMAGGVIEAYEATLEAVVALAFFVPVIMDMGGNVGTQASTIFVRGLALGHIDDKNAFRHFRREGIIGLLIGTIIGGIGAGGAYAWQGLWRGDENAPELALVVFIGLVTVCVVASVVGYVIPWVMNKLGFDPAAASDPLITTVKDVTALLIYFGLATLLLGHLI